MNSFLHTVAEDLIQRFGENLKDVAIVFNNKRPIVFLKKHLAEISDKPIFSPAFFTIQSFFAKSTPLVQADFLVRFFILHDAYNELLRQEQKNEITPDDFLPMAEIILRDFDQIDFDLVDPTAVYSYLKDLALIEQQFPLLTEDQQAFLTQFWSSFSMDKQVHIQEKFIELWSRLPRLYDLFHKKLKEQNLIGISTTYRNLAEGTAESAEFIDKYKMLVFVGFNALNRAEARIFKRWQQEEKTLFYFDADAYYMDDEIQEAGLFLRKTIGQHKLKNALGGFPKLLNDTSKSLEVYPVLGHIAQAKVLNKIIEKSIYSSAQTAIVLADESLLIPVLQTLPNELKINITMGFPLSQSPIFGLMELWFTVQEHLFTTAEDGIDKKDVLAFLSHSLAGIPNLERERMVEIIADCQTTQVPVEILSFSIPHANEFFKKNLSGLEALASLEKIIAALYEWRLEVEHLHLIESSLLVRIAKVLTVLSDSLKEYSPDISVPLAISFLKKAMMGIAAPIEGEPLDGIQVMGMLESRCLDFDEVIILGANEGVLPQLSLSPTFIPDSLRRAFGLPVIENQDALSAYLFYRLLQRAKKVSVVYNSLVESNSTGEASRFLQQVQFESQITALSFPQKQTIQLGTPAPNLKIEKTPEVIDKLNEYLKPNGRSISASGLLTYLKCPLEFFFKYIAGYKEPERPLDALDPGAIGSMVHSVLEDFYQSFLDEKMEVTKDTIHLKIKELSKLCKKALSDFLQQDLSKPFKFNSSQLIALSIVEENARVILNYDANEIAPFRIIELENKEDYRCGFPVEINGIPQTLNLYAIIDRVDEVKGQKRIVDYKTGSDKLTFKLEDICTPISKNLNRAAFQSLLYALVYEQVKGVDGVHPHLYVLRQIQNGSILMMDKEPLEGELLLEAKISFKKALNLLLTEIFDPEIPFSHNEHSIYCKDGVYSQLCHPSGLVNSKEEEIEHG
jgi:hypothetical protein